MSKWLVKKTINERLKKNLVLEETNELFTEAYSLGEYSGGFSFFSSGKKFKLPDNSVVKLSGKKEDIYDYLIPYDDTIESKLYRWISQSNETFINGSVYKESSLSDDFADYDFSFDTGVDKLLLELDDKVIILRGSAKSFSNNLELVQPEIPEPELEETMIQEEPVLVVQEVQPITEESVPVTYFKNLDPSLLKGERGERGERGEKGERGEPGISGLNEEIKNSLMKTIEDFSSITEQIKGRDGVDGERGEKGEKGDKGDLGPRGYRGEKGDKGEKGDRGEVGKSGKQGKKGSKGDKGDRGEQGIKGEKGDRGERGIRGEKGDKGDVGLRGEKGETGKRGERGERGKKGDKGDDGSSGLVDASYPLIYDQDKREIFIDKKFFEKLLSAGGEVNNRMIQQFINAASSGGGGIGVLKDGSIKSRSAQDINFKGDQFKITGRGNSGRWIQIELENIVTSVNGSTGDVTINTAGATQSIGFILDGNGSPLGIGDKLDALRQVPYNSYVLSTSAHIPDGVTGTENEISFRIKKTSTLNSSVISGTSLVLGVTASEEQTGFTFAGDVGEGVYFRELSGVTDISGSTVDANEWIFPEITGNAGNINKLQIFVTLVPN